jgi:Protein of unknown function (DUF2785)
MRSRTTRLHSLALAAALLFPLRLAVSSTALHSNPKHDRAFWHSIQNNHYAVPEGESAVVLAHEVSGYLGSSDPEMRDDIAYSILDVWIVRRPQLSREELIPFLDEWTANLKIGLGESGTDSVLKRSFSALVLSSLAERELKTPFLGPTRFHALLNDAISFLTNERDLRGYDATKGWIHATAHTADLLAALAKNDLLTPDDQHAILAAIAERLATAPTVYSYGEQDRLAQAVSAIITCRDFDSTYFQNWLKKIVEADAKVWEEKPLTPATLATYQNRTYMLEALAARLATQSLAPTAASAQAAIVAEIARR